MLGVEGRVIMVTLLRHQAFVSGTLGSLSASAIMQAVVGEL